MQVPVQFCMDNIVLQVQGMYMTLYSKHMCRIGKTYFTFFFCNARTFGTVQKYTNNIRMKLLGVLDKSPAPYKLVTRHNFAHEVILTKDTQSARAQGEPPGPGLWCVFTKRYQIK